MESLVLFVCLFVCLFERHNKPNKMKDEREDQKCSHSGNVWEGEDLLMIRDDAGIKINQSQQMI